MASVARSIGEAVGVLAGVASIIPPLAPFAAPLAIAATGLSVIGQTFQSPPRSVGSLNERVTGANQPQPYLMGRSYSGGIEVHDVGYGGEVNDVDNPYLFLATVHSCCGPVDGLEAILFDFEPITFDGSGEATGYYEGYAFRDFQLGARPEANELQPQWSGAPRWGSAYKLSSYAAMGVSLRWSKRAKRYAGGQIPIIGGVWRGVKVYDPRLDSTFPGGSGSHRITDETTWGYSENPALHAGTYAYGRYVEGNKVFGVDLGETPIDFSQVVAWANVCDTNNWTIGGIIYEPGDKWNNLKRICQAGGAQPVLTGGMLQFDYQTPRLSLHDVVRDDLSGGSVTAQLGRSWKDRHNTIIARYRSEANRWEYVQSDAVSVAAFVTADGEEKLDEIQYDLVTSKDQAAELATYEVYQRREAGPFVFTCKPHMRGYRPGDCLTLKAEIGLPADQKVIIRNRKIDPVAGTITFTCEAETDTKHAEAIGAVGTAPNPAHFVTSEELDAVLTSNQISEAELRSLITGRNMTDLDPPDGLIQATDADITVETHNADYADGSVSVTGGVITTEDDGSTPITDQTTYFVYYDDLGRAGGAVTMQATRTSTTAANSSTNPARHYVGSITTDTVGGSGTSGNGATPPGWDPDDYF